MPPVRRRHPGGRITILAWVLAVAGAAVAFVVSLAGAMKSVPRLGVREALVAVPLPLLAAIVAGLRRRALNAARGSTGAQVAAAAPLVLALLTLFFVWGSFWFQPGRSR